VNAIESTGVTVLGLNSNCVELVLLSVGDQYVSEETVIRFRCSSERVEKCGGSFFWKMKCHPVCSFSIAIVRVDEKTLGSVLYSGRELVGATHGSRQICPDDEPPAKRCKREDDGIEGTYDYELECYLTDLPLHILLTLFIFLDACSQYVGAQM
jgi:hypothetical protein